MEYYFNVESVVESCIQWIKDWFSQNGPGCNAVLGMSGGKDSTIAAALCAKALGPERVIGVSMPDVGQDICEADKICKHLGIRYLNYPIGKITEAFSRFNFDRFEWNHQAKQNIPPRVRMTVLYAISQEENGRPVCTCNLSESWIGYETQFGDNAGALAPLRNLTVTEILQIGDYLEIPSEWVHKVPDDGLPGSCPDEEKFGFSYKELDTFIRQQELNYEKSANELKLIGISVGTFNKIQKMHAASEFKRRALQLDSFDPVITTSISMRLGEQ